MMNKLITHTIALLLGAFVVFIFNRQSEAIKTSVSILNDDQESTSTRVQDTQSTYAPINSLETSVSDQNVIESLRFEISQLKNQLANEPNDNIEQQSTTQISQSEETVKKMTMKDFENQMKSSFTDQFKGVVLEMTGDRLDAIKASYNSTSEKNEWSNQYENQIANYLNENDHSGDHFLQSLNCNINVCRLEVNTNDEQGWDSVYAGMMKEPWYKSITIQENSDYPGYVVYYLPSFEN